MFPLLGGVRMLNASFCSIELEENANVEFREEFKVHTRNWEKGGDPGESPFYFLFLSVAVFCTSDSRVDSRVWSVHPGLGRRNRRLPATRRDKEGTTYRVANEKPGRESLDADRVEHEYSSKGIDCHRKLTGIRIDFSPSLVLRYILLCVFSQALRWLFFHRTTLWTIKSCALFYWFICRERLRTISSRKSGPITLPLRRWNFGRRLVKYSLEYLPTKG